MGYVADMKRHEQGLGLGKVSDRVE
jgi:hypothetical protein